ncbi:MAG: hypothetical protein AB1568_16085 [Thermodesulfobacteriota bacterium]
MDVSPDMTGAREWRGETAAGPSAARARRQPDPIEMVKMKMRQLGLGHRDMMAYLGGSTGHVSDILNRRRPLTLRMIRRLHEGLGIPAEVLIREYPLCLSG